MLRLFGRKTEDLKPDNKQTVILLAQPRYKFIDQEYEKLLPSINEMLDIIKNLNKSTEISVSEMFIKLKENLKHFKSLNNKLINYRKNVLKLPEYSGNDSLYFALNTFKQAIDQIKNDIDFPAMRLYGSSTEVLNCTINKFEAIKVILDETIISQKENIALELLGRLGDSKQSKNPCPIL
jgi:hypothetical protein